LTRAPFYSYFLNMTRPRGRPAGVKPAGSQIRRLRLERGWSAGDLAVRVKRGRSTIHHVENGRPTDILLIHKLASVFGVKPDDLVDDEQVAA